MSKQTPMISVTIKMPPKIHLAVKKLATSGSRKVQELYLQAVQEMLER